MNNDIHPNFIIAPCTMFVTQNVYVSYVDKDYGNLDKASLIPDLEGWKYVCACVRACVWLLGDT